MAALDLFTLYNNRSLGGVTDPNSDQAQAALRQVQQYDPTASYRPTFGSDGQLMGYTLDYDASKLPGVNGAASLGGTSGHGSGADFMPRFSTVQEHFQLKDPNAVTTDTNYGRITDNTNIQQPSSPLDYLGPAGVAAFAFGIPYIASALSNGALGAGAASGAAAGSAAAPASGTDVGFGGGAGGAANEIGATSSSIGAAGAAANPASIATSNWLVAHGIPSQFGLSNGAVGAAMTEPGLGLGKVPAALARGVSTILGQGSGGGSLGGGSMMMGGGGGAGGGSPDALSLLKGFYGDPTVIGNANLARQRANIGKGDPMGLLSRGLPLSLLYS